MTTSQASLEVIEGGGDPLIGQTIDGRYAVESVLGEGGMGLVYRAKHIVLGKPLAIKVLRPDVSRDEEIIKRFKQEAQSASAIGNQHIIDISDFGALPDKSTYFVMEFLDGYDLTHVIEEQQPIAPRRVTHIARQLCRALGAAHDAGIVHRDLKPDNIYLVKRGEDVDFVKVLDFGIAKVGGSSSKLTRAGQVFGTPHYMSPEQCAGSGVDHRTDIYALGVILYEMVTGKVPFDADNLMGILTKHLYEEPVPPREKNPNIPVDLECVVQRCMAKDAEHRYQTMAEVVADLDRLDAGIRPEATQGFRTAATTNVELPSARGKAPMFIGAGLFLLLAAGGGAYAAFGGDGDTPDPVVAAPPVVTAPPIDPETPVAPEQPGTEPVVTVRVVTEPEGAQVWRADELLGNAPLDLPRPTGEDRLELEARSPGYVNQRFVLSRLTVAEQLRISLERERRRRPGRRPVRPDTTMAETTAPPAMMATMRRTLPQSEVLDPWAAGGN